MTCFPPPQTTRTLYLTRQYTSLNVELKLWEGQVRSIEEVAVIIRTVIIEASRLVRLGLQSILERDPLIQVAAAAETGSEGLQVVQEVKPDVVILDLQLPDISGIQVIQAIKSLNPTVKILILTSSSEPDTVTEALSLKANAYLLKDTQSYCLVEVIKSIHEGALWLDKGISDIALGLISGRPRRKIMLKPLTKREEQVLMLLAECKSNCEIAHALKISIHMAKAHVSSILEKLSLKDRIQAAVLATQENWAS